MNKDYSNRERKYLNKPRGPGTGLKGPPPGKYRDTYHKPSGSCIRTKNKALIKQHIKTNNIDECVLSIYYKKNYSSYGICSCCATRYNGKTY